MGGTEPNSFEANMANPEYVIPRIESVKPVVRAPAVLSVQFANGESGRINLLELFRGKRALAKIREPEIFRYAMPSEHGYGVQWPGGIEIGADTLYWLYRRQHGKWDAADELHTWRISHGLSLDNAAEELGVSRRMLSYYEARKWPVPKTVSLALAGWNAQRKRLAA